MTFEEEFPSVERICSVEEPVEGNLDYHCEKCNTNHILSIKLAKELIQKHCLDKARVRDAIDRIWRSTETSVIKSVDPVKIHTDKRIILSKLKQELRL